MADVKWIKIVTDMFDDEKIVLIEAMPDSDAIIVIWFKLLCLAGKQNNGGVFMLNDRIPYTDEMLSTIFRRPLNTVRLAISTFERFGMVEIINNTITIPSWRKHQNLEGMELAREKTRQRVAAYRERQKQLTEGNVTDRYSDVTVTQTDKDIDIDIDKELDKENIGGKPPRSPKHKYGEYNNVLLTDDELQKLKTEYSDYEERIERLSSYIASTGKKYKSHYATIRNWARKDADRREGNGSNTKFADEASREKWGNIGTYL